MMTNDSVIDWAAGWVSDENLGYRKRFLDGLRSELEQRDAAIAAAHEAGKVEGYTAGVEACKEAVSARVAGHAAGAQHAAAMHFTATWREHKGRAMECERIAEVFRTLLPAAKVEPRAEAWELDPYCLPGGGCPTCNPRPAPADSAEVAAASEDATRLAWENLRAGGRFSFFATPPVAATTAVKGKDEKPDAKPSTCGNCGLVRGTTAMAREFRYTGGEHICWARDLKCLADATRWALARAEKAETALAEMTKRADLYRSMAERAAAGTDGDCLCDFVKEGACKPCRDWARAEAAEADARSLREALKPFAEMVDNPDKPFDQWSPAARFQREFTQRQVAAARKALASPPSRTPSSEACRTCAGVCSPGLLKRCPRICACHKVKP